MTKTSTTIVLEKPRENFRAVDVQLLVKLTFICDLPQEFINLTQIDTLKIFFLPALDSASDLKLSILTILMY